MPASDPRNARLLLTMAAKDVKAVRAMLDPDAFDDEIFGFHCQQAAEKALKGWISLIGVEYQRVHDLGELLSILEDHAEVPERFVTLCIRRMPPSDAEGTKLKQACLRIPTGKQNPLERPFEGEPRLAYANSTLVARVQEALLLALAYFFSNRSTTLSNRSRT